MKIGTTLYGNSSTYFSHWANISDRCDWIITTASNYEAVLSNAAAANILYRTPVGLSIGATKISGLDEALNITSDMIFRDADTDGDAIDSSTGKYIMDLSSSDYITNKIAEINFVFNSCNEFDGIFLDIAPYEAYGADIWNITDDARTYYKQMMQSFIWRIGYEFISQGKLVIPNCNPVYQVYASGESVVIDTSGTVLPTTPVGDYSLAKLSSGEMQEFRLGSDEMNWTALLNYVDTVLDIEGKYFFLYCTSATEITAQNNRDLFKIIGNKSNYLIVLTDMFESSVLEEVPAG